MYRQGLGDCFLVSLKRSKDEPDFKILIDCGVILGTVDATAIMTKVVDDVVADTGGKVDLLLATHEHWDHVSGLLDMPDLPVHLHRTEHQWVGAGPIAPVGGDCASDSWETHFRHHPHGKIGPR